MKGCREICQWARACNVPSVPDRRPEQCDRADFLKSYWKEPDTMNEIHDLLEMQRKVEDDTAEKNIEIYP